MEILSCINIPSDVACPHTNASYTNQLASRALC
jgi:hypothetical protein